MIFHHTGCLVENIEATLASYEKLLAQQYDASEIILIEDQKVKICFIKLGESVFLELVEPLENNKTLQRLLKKKGSNFYHIAFKVEDFDAEMQRLKEQQFRLISSFESEAFGGKMCAFFVNEQYHLIEIIAA